MAMNIWQMVLFHDIIPSGYDLRRIAIMLDLNNLRFFYHVAKNLSFTIAADDLCVTQPSVTKRIKVLEEACNLKLFGKTRGKTYLTEEGKILYDSVKKIFEYEKDIETTIHDIQELKRGTLRLGMPATFSHSALSVLMDHFHQEYPNIKIQVNTGNSKEIIMGLLNHQNEIGTFVKTEDHPDIHFIHMHREKIALITSPVHRFALEKKAPLDEVAKEPLILREIGSGTRKAALELLEQNHLSPNILLETTNPEYIKQLVQRNDGVAFLAEMTVSQEIEQGKLVLIPIKGHQLTIDLCAAYLKNKPLSKPAKAYLKIFDQMRRGSLEAKDSF